jgi:hypothetical protein
MVHPDNTRLANAINRKDWVGAAILIESMEQHVLLVHNPYGQTYMFLAAAAAAPTDVFVTLQRRGMAVAHVDNFGQSAFDVARHCDAASPDVLQWFLDQGAQHDGTCAGCPAAHCFSQRCGKCRDVWFCSQACLERDTHECVQRVLEVKPCE